MGAVSFHGGGGMGEGQDAASPPDPLYLSMVHNYHPYDYSFYTICALYVKRV